MKKILLLLLSAVPIAAFAQSGETPGASIIGGIFIIAICIGLFFAFRGIVLWYWKVDTILKNQEEQIRTQRATNSLLNEYIAFLKEQK